MTDVPLLPSTIVDHLLPTILETGRCDRLTDDRCRLTIDAVPLTIEDLPRSTIDDHPLWTIDDLRHSTINDRLYSLTVARSLSTIETDVDRRRRSTIEDLRLDQIDRRLTMIDEDRLSTIDATLSTVVRLERVDTSTFSRRPLTDERVRIIILEMDSLATDRRTPRKRGEDIERGCRENTVAGNDAG